MTTHKLKQINIKDYFATAFNVHQSLWNCYNNKIQNCKIDYHSNTYDVYHKEDFCCAVLPSYLNANENNFWMTNNMARSTHGTFQINDAKSRSEVYNITWIIGKTASNEHYFKGHVATTYDLSGRLKYANVYSFYYGSQVELYRYINRHNEINYLDSSFVNPNIKIDYLIF
jgi:hypothetical protein